MKSQVLPVVGFLLISLTAPADDDFSKEVIKETLLTPSLYMLEGAGGNMTASIGPDGVLLVDDDFAPMHDKLVAKLKELKGGAPRFIVNTHFHYDHTGGNELFGPIATIIAASEVRTRLMAEQTLWHKTHPPLPTQAWPVLTFEKSITLHWNGDEIRVVHFPHAHTDGDSVVFFQREKVVSMGDLYFSGMYPIFHPEHEGSIQGLIQGLKIILAETEDDVRFVPGHGPSTDKQSVRKYYQMIIASVDTVKRGIHKGLTLEQIKKRGLDPKWESFSHGYRTTDQWLESLYQELKIK